MLLRRESLPTVTLFLVVLIFIWGTDYAALLVVVWGVDEAALLIFSASPAESFLQISVLAVPSFHSSTPAFLPSVCSLGPLPFYVCHWGVSCC